MISRLLCWLGLHDWGHGYTRDFGTHLRVWQFCQRPQCAGINIDKQSREAP